MPPGGEGRLFAGLFAHGNAAAQLSDRAFVEAMVEVEVALLEALAEAGLAPTEAPRELADALRSGRLELDLAELSRGTGEQGTPIPALLRALRRQLSADASTHLHKGATSQDVIDTAMMLVAGRALDAVLTDLNAAADACGALAERWREAIVPGRTLLQQALPVTFGLKAAGWLSGLDGARADLSVVRERDLAVQFGGAVGTLASIGERGLDVSAGIAQRLGLVSPELPWHTVRLRPVRLASACGATLGILGKIGRDVALLAQTEVAEVVEGGGEGRGGSSTMPHKRNPVGAVGLVACAQRGPGLVATMLAGMAQEHERGAGAWQAEWETLLELLRLTGSASAIARELLSGLEADPEKMRADMDLTGGLVMSESVAAALADTLGRGHAQELVEQAARRSVESGRGFRDVLLEVPEVADRLGVDGLDAALDPAGYLGATAALIDRALAVHRAG
ncbi:MAG TPA: 3-carboxy-cis,cis-muconate cycloisomerase [Solirubrobacteraceae bacterium]|nr:3-carboxy-cis,cis-muconate cycloisomerase [Solirubrobacteraceae bacterium]